MNPLFIYKQCTSVYDFSIKLQTDYLNVLVVALGY